MVDSQTKCRSINSVSKPEAFWVMRDLLRNSFSEGNIAFIGHKVEMVSILLTEVSYGNNPEEEIQISQVDWKENRPERQGDSYFKYTHGNPSSLDFVVIIHPDDVEDKVYTY